MGMDARGAADFSMGKVHAALMHTGAKVSRMRQQRQRGETVDNRFTDEERSDMT